jgi:hypothetical protein
MGDALGWRIIDWMMENVMSWFFLVVLVGAIALLAAVPYLFWKDSQAERFSLRKDSWECTRSHQESSTTYIQVGNVMVPSTSYSTVCDQWSAK